MNSKCQKGGYYGTLTRAMDGSEEEVDGPLKEPQSLQPMESVMDNREHVHEEMIKNTLGMYNYLRRRIGCLMNYEKEQMRSIEQLIGSSDGKGESQPIGLSN